VVTTGLDGGGTERPTPFALEQNYPNPFNPSTTISYTLPATTQVVIRIFNVLGAEVATLVEGQQSAGVHHAVFDASGLPSGVYLCRMQAGDFTASRKLLLMR
jgi:glucuronoarabinoxylan endo-1,4-beta-xylanase